MAVNTQVTTFSDLAIKLCSRCKENKSLDNFSCYKDKKQGWCKTCMVSYQSERYKAGLAWKPTTEQIRAKNYHNVHVITIEQYHRILASQEGRCAICKSFDTGGPKHFTVDHSHATGQLRGLLCRPCNMALGLFRDSIPALLQAANYVEGKT